MFKYYIEEDSTELKEVSREDYEEYLILDAECNGVCKTTARRVAAENRRDAKETGRNEWFTCGGEKLVVEYSKRRN
jgi:hypothetical protein